MTHAWTGASREKDDLRRYECIAKADKPPLALIEAADLAKIFARSQAALNLARVKGIYGSAEQCLERVWPRVRQRWSLIESGLAAEAADTVNFRALQHEVAVSDAWQRFEGQPEEREALLAMYAALVASITWPEGFDRSELLLKFMLE